MVIYPEVIVAPDSPTIKFRQPRDQVNLDVELPRILHAQGWGCGTYFHVQFMNHEKTELLACALYVVTKESEGIQTSDNPYQPMTKTVYSREARIVGDWWVSTPKVMTSVWNPGKKMFQVKIGDKVVYETPHKEEGVKIAAGEIEIPA